MKRIVTLMTFSLALMLALPVVAQPRGGGMRGKPTPEMMEKMKEVRGELLREKAGLSEEKAQQVEAVLDANHEQRMELRDVMHSNMEALRQLLNDDSNDQEAFAAALLAVKETRKALQDLREEELEAATQFLTPKEQAKVIVSLKRMHHKARKFMKRQGKGKGMRGEGKAGRGGRGLDWGSPGDAEW